MTRAFVLAACLLVAGCASDIMRAAVGKTLQEGMLEYGPPANAFDMPDGTRAFQWVWNYSGMTPSYATTTGTVTGYGNMALWSQQTVITGGVPIQGQCIYTMFARWDQGRNAWVFTGYKPPSSIMCE